jgi:hypothetical protein
MSVLRHFNQKIGYMEPCSTVRRHTPVLAQDRASQRMRRHAAFRSGHRVDGLVKQGKGSLALEVGEHGGRGFGGAGDQQNLGSGIQFAEGLAYSIPFIGSIISVTRMSKGAPCARELKDASRIRRAIQFPRGRPCSCDGYPRRAPDLFPG